MARRNSVAKWIFGAVALLAVLGSLAWLALAPTTSPSDGSSRGEPTTHRSRATPVDRSDAEPPDLVTESGPGSGASPKSPGGDGTTSPTASRNRDGIAVLDTGRVLPGVFYYEPLEGSLAHVNEKVDLLSRSGSDGRFRFPSSVARLEVGHPHADLVSVESGTLDPTAGGSGHIVHPAAEGTLRLIFRDRPGLAFVLLRDGASGAAITDLTGVRIEWRVPDGRRWRYDFEHRAELGGWIALDEEGFLRSLENPPDPASIRVEFSAPGYERRAVPQSDLKGRVELTLDPVPPDVRGTVVLGEGLGYAIVSASIRPLDEGVPAAATLEVRGLPAAPGPFSLHDLPDGRWALEVRAERAGFVARTTKEFEHFSGTADVGTITLRAGAGIRARILDANGRALPQADVVVVREEEDPLQARRLETDRDGYVSYGDLEPGVRHRVAVLGLPVPMEKIVTSPKEPGKTETVEFRWEGAVVACRFQFTLDGTLLKRPTALKEAPVRTERQTWEDEGVFTTSLLPGPHRFSIEVMYEDGTRAGLYTAEVEVPAGDSWEKTIELKKSENEQ